MKVSNQLQSNILFVCEMAQMRSKTASVIFKDIFKRTDYAGTAVGADKVITQDDIDWADHIFFMDSQQVYQTEEWGLTINKSWTVLAVPDSYVFMEPKLIVKLKERIAPHVDLGE